MSSQAINNHRRFAYIPQLIVIFLYSFIYTLLGFDNPIILAAVTYLLLSITLRIIIPIHHRRGLRFYKLEQYEEAIKHFQKSSDFFEKYQFFDRYRYILMLSGNNMSYLEMGLLNMAFCFEQIGNNQKAKELYIKTLSLFPHCQMAKDALKLMAEMGKI